MNKGKPLETCKTCGSEIVETVNDGVFRDGECDACEYLRYSSQPDLITMTEKLLLVCEERISMIEEERAELGWPAPPEEEGWYDDCNERIRHYERLQADAEKAIAKAYGKAF